MAFPHTSVGQESTCNAGDPSSIPGLGRSAGEGIAYPLQYSWASLVIQLVKNLLAMHLQCRRPGFDPWVGKIPWRREQLPTSVFWPGDLSPLPYSNKNCLQQWWQKIEEKGTLPQKFSIKYLKTEFTNTLKGP